MRRANESIDFHGTILCSSQLSGVQPIITSQSFQPPFISSFAKPHHILHSERVGNSNTVRSGLAIVLALCWYYRQHLVSSITDEKVSLGHILKLYLGQSPTADRSEMENSSFLHAPSNNEGTTLHILRSVAATVEKIWETEGEKRALYPITANKPLYLQMIKVLHDAPPRMRNVEFEGILPQMGLIHTSMAILDAAKRVSYDECLEGLIQFSGLSTGAQCRFRNLKGFKTNLRFIFQRVTAMAIRFTEVLVEEGDLSFPEQIFSSTRTLEDMQDLLRNSSSPNPTYPEWFSIPVQRHFLPPDLLCAGDTIAQCIQRKIASITEPNGSFYGTVLLNVLIPCILFHHFSRSRLLLERNHMLTHFIPVVYATSKLNYQHAHFCDLLEKVSMPQAAHRVLYQSGGTTCS